MPAATVPTRRVATVPTRRVATRVRSAVLAWYDREHRAFPWRGTTDPYAVLVSEVMLQQTQASRVAERYPRFLARFPTPASLAAASPAAVLAEWSGLGYNRRALALRGAATAVVRDGWPADAAGLERLPGIGPYTARAVASLAFGTPVGVCRSRAPRCHACPVARGCPSRRVARAVPVPRQEPLAGSDRAVRGAVVRLLGDQPRHRLAEVRLRDRIDVDDERWERALASLERDGLVHRSRDGIGLGAATIGP